MTFTNQAPALRRLPPGPRWPLPVQTLRFGLDPYGLFESAHRAFGDVFTLRVMAETWVILAHPDAVRELYRHGPDELDSGVANMALRPLLGTQNLLLLDGGEHLRRRKLVLPPFHGERMLAYEDLIREATRREVAAWPLGVPLPTLPRMHAITLQVVLRAVFGARGGAAIRPARLEPPAADDVDDRSPPRLGVRLPRPRSADGARRFPAPARRSRWSAARGDRQPPRGGRPRRAGGHPVAAAAGARRGRRGAVGPRVARRAHDPARRRARDDRRGAELGAHGGRS